MKTGCLRAHHQSIVADLEQGVRPWLKPWNAEHAAGRITRPLRFNGLPYQGINVLMLWGEAVAKGFAAPIWMTFRQAQELGGACAQGRERQPCRLCRQHPPNGNRRGHGRGAERDIPFLKGYTVFNVEQIDGLPAQFYAKAEPRLDPVQRIERAEAFFAATGAVIRHGGNQAYYSVSEDRVQMPPFEAFRDAEVLLRNARA